MSLLRRRCRLPRRCGGRAGCRRPERSNVRYSPRKTTRPRRSFAPASSDDSEPLSLELSDGLSIDAHAEARVEGEAAEGGGEGGRHREGEQPARPRSRSFAEPARASSITSLNRVELREAPSAGAPRSLGRARRGEHVASRARAARAGEERADSEEPVRERDAGGALVMIAHPTVAAASGRKRPSFPQLSAENLWMPASEPR